MVRRYLDIMQVRFQGRLEVETRADERALDALVPNLILQPLVENAIRHGIAPRASAGRVEISAQRRNGMLELRISDNGVGCGAGDTPPAEGVGLGNTRARLQHLYGADQRLELKSAPGGGFTVTLSIPFRTGAERTNGRTA